MRVCTWNIQYGARLEAVLLAVRSLPDFRDIDLVALQEASTHDGLEDAAAVAGALGPGYSHVQFRAQVRAGREQANALIWRDRSLSPRSTGYLDLKPAPEVPRRGADRILLRAAPPQGRIAVRAEAEAWRAYSIHLDVAGFGHRLAQFQAVLADARSRPQVPLTLIAGDVNTFGPPGFPLWRRLGAAARAAGLVEVSKSVAWTHRTRMKLDAIYAGGPRLQGHRAWMVPVQASDHMPLFAELEPAP